MSSRDALRALKGKLDAVRGLRDKIGKPQLRLVEGSKGFGPVVGPAVGPDFWYPPDFSPPPPASAPLDYAVDDEEPLPAAARPMFSLCEKVLLGSLCTMGGLLVWLGYTLGTN